MMKAKKVKLLLKNQTKLYYAKVRQSKNANPVTNHILIREDARGVAGVAAATPKFQVLLYKMVLKWISKKFLYIASYPNLKFLTSSLDIADTFLFFSSFFHEHQNLSVNVVNLSTKCQFLCLWKFATKGKYFLRPNAKKNYTRII